MEIVNKSRKVLLVIDIQKEFIDKYGEIYNEIVNYSESGIKNSYYDLVIGTYFKNKIPSNFDSKLHWNGCKNASEKSVPYTPDILIEKNTYIVPNLDKYVNKNDEITVVGCDIDACIFVNAAYLFDNEYNFKILSDYIYTTSEIEKETLLKILKRNFGDCVV